MGAYGPQRQPPQQCSKGWTLYQDLRRPQSKQKSAHNFHAATNFSTGFRSFSRPYARWSLGLVRIQRSRRTVLGSSHGCYTAYAPGPQELRYLSCTKSIGLAKWRSLCYWKWRYASQDLEVHQLAAAVIRSLKEQRKNRAGFSYLKRHQRRLDLKSIRQ